MPEKKRYIVAGAGGRATSMFCKPLLTDFPETAELVGMFDRNLSRLKAANSLLGTDLPVFTDFDEILSELDPDGVVVATQDSTHAEFIIRSLDAGKRAYSEKPLCTTDEQCRAIRDAEARSEATCMVTHNMRYGSSSAALKQQLMSGKIGKLLSIEFRETLDRSHGADYFRRWHRRKENSGGLLIHKASHHFDFLNWLAGAKPDELAAMGATLFYGANGPFRHTRCQGCPHAETCDFYFDLSRDERGRALYLETERDDGYIRDGCVFDNEITTEDQASVIYTYDNGVRVSYSLLAFAAYEGMLVVLEGTEGRLEYESVKDTTWAVGNRVVPGMEEMSGPRLTYYHPRKGPEQLEIPRAEEGSHGGADPALRRDFFGLPWDAERPDRMASLDEAIQAVLIGAAANESIANNGQPVKVQSLLEG